MRHYKIMALCLSMLVIPTVATAQTNVKKAFDKFLNSSKVVYTERHSLDKAPETNEKSGQYDIYEYTISAKDKSLITDLQRAFDKDKEQAMPMFQIFFKHDVLPTELRGTVAKLMMDYMSSVVSGVLNERLQEMTQKDDCPFTMAASFDDSYMGMTKMKDAYILYVIPKEGQATEALKTVMTEVERIRRFGLTATEVNRQRDEYLSTLEKTYDNRDKQTHDFFVPQ